MSKKLSGQFVVFIKVQRSNGLIIPIVYPTEYTYDHGYTFLFVDVTFGC